MASARSTAPVVDLSSIDITQISFDEFMELQRRKAAAATATTASQPSTAARATSSAPSSSQPPSARSQPVSSRPQPPPPQPASARVSEPPALQPVEAVSAVTQQIDVVDKQARVVTSTVTAHTVTQQPLLPLAVARDSRALPPPPAASLVEERLAVPSPEQLHQESQLISPRHRHSDSEPVIPVPGSGGHRRHPAHQVPVTAGSAAGNGRYAYVLIPQAAREKLLAVLRGHIVRRNWTSPQLRTLRQQITDLRRELAAIQDDRDPVAQSMKITFEKNVRAPAGTCVCRGDRGGK